MPNGKDPAKKPGEEMFSSPDNRSLRRGRRIAPRTEVCRPCLVWMAGAPEHKRQGVVLDLNPHGMKIRMLEAFPNETRVQIQMMRDEDFRMPLSPPISAVVVRVIQEPEGFIDHGIKVVIEKIKRPEEIKPLRLQRSTPQRRLKTRMHTADYTLGNRGEGRTGRNRG